MRCTPSTHALEVRVIDEGVDNEAIQGARHLACLATIAWIVQVAREGNKVVRFQRALRHGILYMW